MAKMEIEAAARRRIHLIASHFAVTARDDMSAATYLLPMNCRSSQLNSVIRRGDSRVNFARQGSSCQASFMRQGGYGQFDTPTKYPGPASDGSREAPLYSRPPPVRTPSIPNESIHKSAAYDCYLNMLEPPPAFARPSKTTSQQERSYLESPLHNSWHPSQLKTYSSVFTMNARSFLCSFSPHHHHHYHHHLQLKTTRPYTKEISFSREEFLKFGGFQFNFHHVKKRRSSNTREFGRVYASRDNVKELAEGVLKDVNGILLSNKEDEEDDDGLPWWEEFPKRWIIVLLCFSAFLLCNMDRVNMSIAILPMSAEYNWSPTTVGLIQSSFFWGYLLTQIAGGIWADTVGGKMVLGFGVVWWSVATILTPIAAKLGLPFLFVVRALMGIGEGVAMPAMNNILSKWVPVAERSRSLALVYSGMYLGSVTGLAFSPLLIHQYGWPSVFFSFGSLGTVWFAVWLSKAHSSPIEDPNLRPAERKLIASNSVSREPIKSIPWGLILSKPPVWALIVSHFCHNWGTFILLTWMPTYYNQVLKFNLMESGFFAVLPWLTMALSANLGGWIADTLISKGYSVTSVRKIMQSIGFLGPAFFLTQLNHVHSPAMAVLCMACSQGTDAFSQSGLYSNHQDIAPRYSGVLLGLSNTAGVLAGVFGTAATGYILQHGSWDDVFGVSVSLYLVGTVVWNLFSTGEKIID